MRLNKTIEQEVRKLKEERENWRPELLSNFDFILEFAKEIEDTEVEIVDIEVNGDYPTMIVRSFGFDVKAVVFDGCVIVNSKYCNEKAYFKDTNKLANFIYEIGQTSFLADDAEAYKRGLIEDRLQNHINGYDYHVFIEEKKLKQQKFNESKLNTEEKLENIVLCFINEYFEEMTRSKFVTRCTGYSYINGYAQHYIEYYNKENDFYMQIAHGYIVISSYEHEFADDDCYYKNIIENWPFTWEDCHECDEKCVDFAYKGFSNITDLTKEKFADIFEELLRVRYVTMDAEEYVDDGSTIDDYVSDPADFELIDRECYPENE